VTCEEVRPLLPELAEGVPREAGEIQVHLATCRACSAELARYRSIVLELAALREVLAQPPDGLLARLLDQVPERQWRALVQRVASDERLHYAALSLGGAVVGATAIGLLWWRARRGFETAGSSSLGTAAAGESA
jgi:anti-sigma factor RsiW